MGLSLSARQIVLQGFVHPKICASSHLPHLQCMLLVCGFESGVFILNLSIHWYSPDEVFRDYYCSLHIPSQ